MKLFFIGSSIYVLYLMRVRYRLVSGKRNRELKLVAGIEVEVEQLIDEFGCSKAKASKMLSAAGLFEDENQRVRRRAGDQRGVVGRHRRSGVEVEDSLLSLVWHSFQSALISSRISNSSHLSISLCASTSLASTFSRPTHDPAIDTIKLEYLCGPALVLALLFNYGYTILELSWAFSIYLEAVAILPQLFMLQRTGEAETITTHYLFALGAYRALYIPNWIYR